MKTQQLKWSTLALLALLSFTGFLCPGNREVISDEEPKPTENALYYSYDDGQTWSLRETGPYHLLTDGVVNHSDALFAIGNEADFSAWSGSISGLSIDSWTTFVRDPSNEHGEFKALSMSGNDIWAATNDKLLKKADDHWMDLSPALFEDFVDVVFNRRNPLMGVLATKDYFGYTTDGGLLWEFSTSLTMSTVVDIISIDAETYIAATNGGTKRSTDHGMTWETVDETNLTSIAMEERTGIVIGCDGTKLRRSTDRGNTWSTIELDPLPTTATSQVKFFPIARAGDSWVLGERHSDYNVNFARLTNTIYARKLSDDATTLESRKMLFETQKNVGIKFIRSRSSDVFLHTSLEY